MIQEGKFAKNMGLRPFPRNETTERCDMRVSLVRCNWVPPAMVLERSPVRSYSGNRPKTNSKKAGTSATPSRSPNSVNKTNSRFTSNNRANSEAENNGRGGKTKKGGSGQQKARDLFIWQHNLNHGTKVVGEIRNELVTNRVDLLLMQEPYIWKNSPVGFGSSAKLAYATDTATPKAAILTAKEGVNISVMRHLTTEHLVCVQVSTPSVSPYAISCYFQYADPIEKHVN